MNTDFNRFVGDALLGVPVVSVTATTFIIKSEQYPQGNNTAAEY